MRGLCDKDASLQTETGEDLEGTEAQPRATDGEDNFQRLLDRESKWLTYGVRMPFIKQVAPIYGTRDSTEPPPHPSFRNESHLRAASHFCSTPPRETLVAGQPIMPIGCYSLQPPMQMLTRAQRNSHNLSGAHQTPRTSRSNVRDRRYPLH